MPDIVYVAKAGISCFFESEVLYSGFVLLINSTAAKHNLRKSA
jgi:hypothetical protein